MKDKDLKQFVEKYGDDVCNAILKLADGEECSNELERLVLAEVEGGEVGRFIDAYGEEFFDDLYVFMKRKASMAANRTPYKKGDVIGQKYEVHDVLGMGGFGIVYLVYSHETESVYALKTFRDEYLEDTQTRERFKKEAQIWIALERHPYIVRAYFVDEISGRLFIATEYIAPDEEGLNTLDAFLRRRPPDLAQSLKWGIQFCHGMEYAFSKGIRAHRDIKPANILIGQDRSVKISDFGLAGVIGQARISGIKLDIWNNKVGFSCQTMEGSGFGTPPYMPPEQFTNAAACDVRSDIYSFGIVLYQLATGGNRPFLANLPQNEEEHKQFWHDMHRLHSQAPVPGLDSPLFPIIQKCLEKEPNRRYRSFKDLRTDLEPLLKRLTGEVVKVPEMGKLGDVEWSNKGVSLCHLGKLEKAITCFDKALEINPSDAYAWYNKGYTLHKLGRYKETIFCYDQALMLKIQRDRIWHDKGIALAALGKHQDALVCYDRSLKMNYRDEVVWINKGVSLSNLDKLLEGLACFDEALKINPRNEAAWNNRGKSFYNLGKYQEAIICFNKSLEINSKDTDIWWFKGLIMANLGKYNDALVCYDKLLEINPRDAGAWYDKGGALGKLGKPQDEVACYDKVLEINPRDADAWYNKGNALGRLGKPQEAIACYDRSLEISPNDAKAWYNKALAEDGLEIKKTALQSYEKFIELAHAQDAEQIEYARQRLNELGGSL